MLTFKTEIQHFTLNWVYPLVQTRDPTLFSNFVQSHATVSEEEQKWSFTILPADALWTDDMKNEDEVIFKTILIMQFDISMDDVKSL